MGVEAVFTLAGIADLIWFVVMFFVPFLIIGMSRRVTSIEQSTDAMVKIMFAAIDDSKLSEDLLAKKYGIRGGHDSGGFFFDGRSFTDFASAMSAAREKFGLPHA